MVKNKTGWNRYFLWRFFTILLLGALFVLTGGTGSAAPAGSLPVITVSTPEEFMRAIGPDRIIRIEAEVLQLPNEKVPFASDYVTQQEVIDGYQLLIHDVANLTITGAGEKPVRILSEPVYGYVLGFRNAEKIRIQSVEAGHIPHQGISGNREEDEEDNYPAAPTGPYAEYSINLEYLIGLYVDSLLYGTDNTAKMEKIYTEMVEVLLELERTQGNNDIELDLLLGVYHTIGYQAGIISDMRLAEERFQNVLREDPHSLPGHYGLAELYFTDCIFEELEFNKDESFVAYCRKKTDAEMMEKALAAYLNVLRLKDQNIEDLAPADHYRIVTLFFFTGKADRALEYAQQLAALDPERYGKCLEIVEELGKKKENPWRIEFPLMLMY